MKKTAVGLVLMFIIGTSLYLFYALGGFNEIQISIKNLGEIELTGIHYRGTPQDEALGKAFQKIEAIQKSYPQSFLHTIYFIEPAGKLDTMEVFIGIESSWMDQTSDYTIINFNGSQVIVAELSAHRLVMPGPKKVKNKIEKFAEANNLLVPNTFIDQIIGPKEVKVLGVISHVEK